MSPRKGRPTDEPKSLNTRVRLSENDVERLGFCAEKLNITRAEVIRKGIEKIYEEIKKEK